MSILCRISLSIDFLNRANESIVVCITQSCYTLQLTDIATPIFKQNFVEFLTTN